MEPTGPILLFIYLKSILSFLRLSLGGAPIATASRSTALIGKIFNNTLFKEQAVIADTLGNAPPGAQLKPLPEQYCK